MLGKIISPEYANEGEWRTFPTRVDNEKRRLRSSQRLSWSSRTGWQAVSTTIFEWLLKLCDGSSQWETTLAFKPTTTKMLGEIISPEQSTKMNDFATVVANEKRRLRSSQRLPRCSAKLSLQSNQKQRQMTSWIFDWRCGRTIASSRRITCS